MANDGRPEYCDPRAEKFYSWVYSGTRTASGYHWSWSSCHEELQPTAVHSFGHNREICAHCGNRALPIQKRHSINFGSTSYIDRGYTCVCKGAMDECEWRAKWVELKAKHEEEEAELLKSQPQLSKEVCANVVNARLTEIADQFKRCGHLSDRDCKDFGINFGSIPEGKTQWD